MIKGNTEIIKFLLDRGADVNKKGYIFGEKEYLTTPLIISSCFRRIKITELLLKRGADTKLLDSDLANALHWTSTFGIIDTAKLLINYKADINQQDNVGWTPLHVACFSKNIDMAIILILIGADINIKNNEGKIPFEYLTEDEGKEILDAVNNFNNYKKLNFFKFNNLSIL